MAIIHKATLSPSKLDLLSAHIASLPTLSEHVGDDLSQVGAYRFDDPAGDVGIETHILTSSSGAYLQIPLVYRNDEAPNASDAFLGTMEHSVLGTRWVYNACADAIYVGELIGTVLSGGTEVDEIVETPDGPVPRATSVQVVGSGDGSDVASVPTELHASSGGDQTLIDIGDYVVMISHVLDIDTDESATTDLNLTGVWAGQEQPVTLARMVRSGSSAP